LKSICTQKIANGQEVLFLDPHDTCCGG
jgi:hypothetical protein